MKTTLSALAFATLLGTSANAATICNPNIDYVNVRSGPSAIDFPVRDKLSNGHFVRVQRTTTNVDGYDWVQVVYNGYLGRMVGWIDASNVCRD